MRGVLREQVVDDADLIDAGVIFGTGFAPFRGGPLAYARSRGVDEVVARLTELAAALRLTFQPDAGWQRLRPEKRDRDPGAQSPVLPSIAIADASQSPLNG